MRLAKSECSSTTTHAWRAREQRHGEVNGSISLWLGQGHTTDPRRSHDYNSGPPNLLLNRFVKTNMTDIIHSERHYSLQTKKKPTNQNKKEQNEACKVGQKMKSRDGQNKNENLSSPSIVCLDWFYTHYQVIIQERSKLNF